MLHLHARHTGKSLGRVEDLILTGDGLLKKDVASAGRQNFGLWLARNGSSVRANCWSEVGDAGSEGADGGSGREGDEDGGGCELHGWMRTLQDEELCGVERVDGCLCRENAGIMPKCRLSTNAVHADTHNKMRMRLVLGSNHTPNPVAVTSASSHPSSGGK